MMGSMIGISNCSNCGSNDVYVAACEYGFFCGCNDCDTRTPILKTIDEVAEFWNVRYCFMKHMEEGEADA